MTPRQRAAKELVDRDDARGRLLRFVEYTHPDWQSGKHHERICEALERVERGECRRLMIFAPPRHSKSELASRRFPAWFLGRNPDKQIITATYAADFAVDFGADVRDIIKSQDFRNVFPGVELHPDRKAASRWRTNQGGIYVASGVGGPITGRGAHLALIDDPIKNREDADSSRKRDKVWKWYNSTLYTRLMPGGAIVVMMTRWHEDDLAGRLFKQGGWDVIELAAIENEHTDHEAALWPEWFPLDVMRDKRDKIPPREWAALYCQHPTTDTGTYCKREWFADRYDVKPEHLRIFGFSDYAVTEPEEEDESRGPDYTEHAIIGIAPDTHAYVLDWWYGRTTPDEWIERQIDLMASHKPQTWYGESGVIRNAIEPTLTRRMLERKVFCDVEWLPSIGDKMARGRSFQGRAAMKTVHFPKHAPWADRVIDQLVGFPGALFDDAFDVCSLFGRALDETDPAVSPSPQKPREKDRWKAAFKPPQRVGWKGA